MSKKRKLYKTVITVEVLSEDDFPTEIMSLKSVEYMSNFEGWSMQTSCGRPKRVTEKQMVRLCKKQQTDPEFFGLDSKGRSLRK